VRSLVPVGGVERLIHEIRGQRVILDSDLADLYRVPTKRLNEQVKRNRNRFPKDFMFRLTDGEKAEVVANCDHLQRLKFSPTLPFAFTEHGALMLASVLKTSVAIDVSIAVVRAFIRLRQYALSHRELAARMDALEKKYDVQFKVVFDAIRQLMEPPPERPRPRIGFGA
jgi:hypothetical protein